MKKSIYNKALDNLTWLLHDEFDDNPKRSRLNVSQRLNLFKKVKDTLEQAIKDEKLLKQHQKIASAIVRISIEQPIYVIKESDRELVEQSFNRIRELENDK